MAVVTVDWPGQMQTGPKQNLPCGSTERHSLLLNKGFKTSVNYSYIDGVFIFIGSRFPTVS